MHFFIPTLTPSRNISNRPKQGFSPPGDWGSLAGSFLPSFFTDAIRSLCFGSFRALASFFESLGKFELPGLNVSANSQLSIGACSEKTLDHSQIFTIQSKKKDKA